MYSSSAPSHDGGVSDQDIHIRVAAQTAQLGSVELAFLMGSWPSKSESAYFVEFAQVIMRKITD
jgi:hypothetical protein